MLEKIDENNHINADSVFAVFLSTALWRLCYGATRFLLPKKNPEYCCRIITFIHGLVVAALGSTQCSFTDSPFEHPEWASDFKQSLVLVISLGYFIHDLVWCLEYQAEDKLMIAHHICSICALFRILFKGYSGAQATCALAALEGANPFLQARWFIRSEGMYPSSLHTLVEITFILIFTIVRILLGTYYTIVSVKQPNNEWDVIVCFLTMYIVSWMFFVNITKYVLAKYFSVKKFSNILSKEEL